LQFQPGLDKGLLCCILGDLHIAAHAIDHIQHTLGMGANQFTVGIPIAFLCSGDQLSFVGL
jgi:hypothetical protein